MVVPYTFSIGALLPSHSEGGAADRMIERVRGRAQMGEMEVGPALRRR